MKKIETRKSEHLSICLQEEVCHGSTRFDEIHLVHNSLPELSFDEIDIATRFLGKRVWAPIFISCMTGGSKEGASINAKLAEVADHTGIPLGLGSIRILFSNSEFIKDFSLRHLAPSVPIFANLGVNQLRHISEYDIFTMLETLKVDALALHLNPAQELYQLDGERDFRQHENMLKSFIQRSPIPIIVKETGYGIHPHQAELLLGYGAYYVDIAGGGGTNWAKVEQLRNEKQFPTDWGDMLRDVYDLSTPSAILMLAMEGKERILSSGGIRSAGDVLKSLRLGAKGVGMALPFLNQVQIGSQELISYIEELKTQLRRLMLLCGAKHIGDIYNIKFWLENTLQKDLVSYCKSLGVEIPKRIKEKLH